MNSREELEELRDSLLRSGIEITADNLRQFQTAIINSMLNILDDIRSLAASKALALDSDKEIVASVGTDVLQFLVNVTSDIQDQLDGKLPHEDPEVKGRIKWDASDGEGIEGKLDGGDAPVGIVGEYFENKKDSAAALPLTTITPCNVVSIDLQPGDWDIEGHVNFKEVNAQATDRVAGVSQLSFSLPSDGTEVYNGNEGPAASTTNNSITIPRRRISTPTPKTAILVAMATFSGGNVDVFGTISARRIR